MMREGSKPFYVHQFYFENYLNPFPRYMVPDVPDALKQRIQREAFICNELTIRDEDPVLDDNDDDDEEEDIKHEDIL